MNSPGAAIPRPNAPGLGRRARWRSSIRRRPRCFSCRGWWADEMEPAIAGASVPRMTATEVETRRHRDSFAAMEAWVDAAPTARPLDAERKAFALLKEWLSPEQLAEYQRNRCFEVV